MNHIAILGYDGRGLKSRSHALTAFTWTFLDAELSVGRRPFQVRDYDVVVLNLALESKSDFARAMNSITWLLDAKSIYEFLVSESQLFIVGNINISIGTYNTLTGLFDLGFVWDMKNGSRIFIESNVPRRLKEHYEKHQEYSNSLVRFDKAAQQMYGKTFKDQNNVNTMLSFVPYPISKTKFNTIVSGTFKLVKIYDVTRDYGMYSETELGSITYLPATPSTFEEVLDIVLYDLIQIVTSDSEPEWVNSIIVHGQERIEGELAALSEQINTLESSKLEKEQALIDSRGILRLLYDTGSALELEVWNALRSLGAEVEEPIEGNKEDGWIHISIGNKSFDGVLEIKSTKNDSFGEKSLRQVEEWKTLGINERNVKYKGIIIGSSSCERPLTERPDPFSPSFLKGLQLRDVVFLKAEDLYLITDAHRGGRVSKDEFWESLFETVGVFDIGSVTISTK